MSLPDAMNDNLSLAQSTVYRDPPALELAGVVRRIATNDDYRRFELSEAVSGHHHHHLICSSCGDVTDFEVSATVEHELETALARVARRAGFQVRTHRLDLVGTCASCS